MGVDGIIFRTQSGTAGYMFHDAHGDITAVYNAAKGKLADYTYDAWGNQTAANTSAWSQANPVRYNGQYYDAESGMTYLRARYYDSSIQRFITEDPAKDGMNWYSYANNNPVMFVDPDGENAHALIEVNKLVMRLLSYKAEWNNPSGTSREELNSRANDVRAQINNFMADNFYNDNLRTIFISVLGDGANKTIEETSALLVLTDYYRNQLDKNEDERNLSLQTLTNIYNNAKRKNTLYYIDIGTVSIHELVHNYFYPYRPSQDTSGYGAYGSGKQATNVLSPNEQEDYQYAPDSM